jgi:hypothetical protein
VLALLMAVGQRAVAGAASCGSRISRRRCFDDAWPTSGCFSYAGIRTPERPASIRQHNGSAQEHGTSGDAVTPEGSGLHDLYPAALQSMSPYLAEAGAIEGVARLLLSRIIPLLMPTTLFVLVNAVINALARRSIS